MKSVKKLLSIFLIFSMVIIMVPHDVFAAAKKPGRNRIIKVTDSQKKASTVKVTVNYTKAKNAKEYRLYNVVAKTGWKYWKTVKASQKKKYSNTKKYKLVKKGKKFKVYRKKTTKIYKPLAKSKKLSASFTGKYNTNYKLVVKAFNGKKSGTYSAVKNFKPRRPTPDYAKYETYVFFGSDSRANDESWKSINGGKNTTDKSGVPKGTPCSDVIMLFNVDRSKKTINITSVYRDTAMDINSGNEVNFQKAKQAYAKYGPKQACRVLEENLDIKIKGYAAANFRGVADVIDTLIEMSPEKGIKISGKDLNTKINENDEDAKTYWGKTVIYVANHSYIEEMNNCYEYDNPVPYIESVSDSNYQYLSGLQAVAYARVRYTEGGDMQRSVRQRNVLRQMISLYRGLNDVERIKTIITASKAGIEVGFLDESNTGNYERLVNIIKAVSKYTISYGGYPYYKKGYNKGSEGYMFIPCDIKTNVTKLHNQIYKESWYAPKSAITGISQALEKKTKLGYGGRVVAWDNKY